MSLMDHKLTIPYPAYRHKDTVFVHRVHALEGEPPGGLKIEFNLSWYCSSLSSRDEQ